MLVDEQGPTVGSSRTELRSKFGMHTATQGRIQKICFQIGAVTELDRNPGAICAEPCRGRRSHRAAECFIQQRVTVSIAHDDRNVSRVLAEEPRLARGLSDRTIDGHTLAPRFKAIAHRTIPNGFTQDSWIGILKYGCLV